MITDWKRLWCLVSGIHHETPEDTVLEELMSVSQELTDGLLQFKTTAASKTRLEDLLTEKRQLKLLGFTQRLQDLLDLESGQCWDTLCYYLTNEYRGSAGSLSTLIATETSMTKLLDDIWGYYTLERIVVLKLVKNLLVFYAVPDHPYQNEYKRIVDHIGLSKLRDSYLRQLEHLIEEQPPPKLIAGEFFNFHTKLLVWAERNAREINELLHILLFIFEHLPASVDDVKRLFACFRQHSFGRQQSYLDRSTSVHAQLMSRLACSEIVLFLRLIDTMPKDASACADLIAALDRPLSRMYDKPEHGPLLLGWMILYLRSSPVGGEHEEELFRKSRHYGQRALQLDCFGYMRDMMRSAMFGDDSLVSRIARRTLYHLLGNMCDYFDGDGSCAAHPHIYELLAELLSWPALAKEFCSSDGETGGVRSLYNTLLETFPLDFAHLSQLASALTKAGMGSYVKGQLESLPILTVPYDEAAYPLRCVSDGEYTLLQSVRPFGRAVDLVIPEGVSAAVLPRPQGYCVHLRHPVNFFQVLHNEINCLLSDATQLHGEFESSERVRRVNAGLEYLVEAVQLCKSVAAIGVEMVHPTEMCVDLLHKFKLVQNPPVTLLANCLRVCTALLPLVDEQILARVCNLQILPQVSSSRQLDDYRQCTEGVGFDSFLMGSWLVDVEKKLGRFDFLLAYLGFLRTHTKLQRQRFHQVELPGLVFLLREVFPHIYTWRYADELDRNKIYLEMMGFICDILDSVQLAETPEKKRLRDLCVYSLLNLENGLMLLRFVAVGNAYLQHTMEMETNWMLQTSNSPTLLVRLAMRILMQLLRLKRQMNGASAELSPLEALIYTQPKQRDTLRIIPVVTSYMSNIFDRWLPILSCRLLRRIALEFNMSLLACLDMEPDQIRLIFLQKLPDELESDHLKVAILELVEACIGKQPGMTEAFFKVSAARDQRRLFGGKTGAAANKQIADSILLYIEDYLEAVAKEPAATVSQSLPSRIMNLVHALWKHNMQSLLGELVAKKDFWTKLCSPLFGSELLPNVRTYTQLLNIMAIELYSQQQQKPAANSELQTVVERFLGAENFGRWLDFVFDMPQVPAPTAPLDLDADADLPEWLCRLQAFKGLLTILLRRHSASAVPRIAPKQFKGLAEQLLSVLVQRGEYLEDLRPFILLAEMFLLVLQHSPLAYTETPEQDRRMVGQVIQLMRQVESCYVDLHVRAKEACLAIAVRSAQLLRHVLLDDSRLALDFLHSAVSIICMELQHLERAALAPAPSSTCSSSSTLTLSLNLLKTVALIFQDEAGGGLANWDLPFIVNKVFQRLLSCAAAILQEHSHRQLAVELLDVLILFGEGHCSAEFMHCDVGDYLWLRLLPPRALLQPNFGLKQTAADDTWSVQQWWPIYTRGIQLVSILLQRHRHHFLHDALQFVGIHEEYLMDSLRLGSQSLEPLAMALIKAAANLMCELASYERQWRIDHPQSLMNLMRGVQALFGHSISMFHQPKNLKCLVAGRRSTLDILRDGDGAVLNDEAAKAFNELSEIIIVCAKCLQFFGPPLAELICDPELLISRWEPILEVHFGAPKMSEAAVSLTFGTVLSIVSVYAKALNLQHYGFHESPLNELPGRSLSGDDGPASSPADSSQRNTTTADDTTKSTASRLMPGAANELLAYLDGDICLTALEHVLAFVASQSMLTLKNAYMQPREKQLIKREISTELTSYHDFVRKRVLSRGDNRSMWQRRKHGQQLMAASGGEVRGDSSASAPGARTANVEAARRHSSDLRVNVVRRLHLQQHRTPSHGGGEPRRFDMTQPISPIGQQEAASGSCIASTPHGGAGPRSALHRPGGGPTISKRVHYEDEIQLGDEQEDEEELELLPPEEPSYTSLSYVQLVEEDFLHCMSNLFTVICQSD